MSEPINGDGVGFMLQELDADTLIGQNNAAPAPRPALWRPTRAQAEAAVRTLIAWAGDDPTREGLTQTPARVARAYEEWFSGHAQEPAGILERTFAEVGGYQDVVLMRDIPLESTCEHHMAPIRGAAHIAYLPSRRVVGISKLARLVDLFSRRLQIQERLTAEIADALEAGLQPLGVAVVVEARHECMSSRGVRKHGSLLVTRALRGVYQEGGLRQDVLGLLHQRPSESSPGTFLPPARPTVWACGRRNS